MFKTKAFHAFVATLLVGAFSSSAEATHFRYGYIRYTIPDPVMDPRTVRFDVVTAWRDPNSPGGFIEGSTDLEFGDGMSNGDQLGLQTGSGLDSEGEAYIVYRYTATHTYAAQGQYTASFESAARISSLINATGTFRVEAKVDITPGNTGNAVSAVPAIVQLQTGGVRTIQFAAIDPDQTPVTCRFSTPSEMGGGTHPPKIPTSNVMPVLTPSTNPPGCLLTWDTTTAMAGQKFALQVVLESRNAMNNNLSSAVQDFIVAMVQSPPPACTGGGSFVVDMGQTLNRTIVGTDFGGLDLKLSALGQIGVLSPAVGTMPSPFSTNFTWTPSLGEQGAGILTLLFTNALNISGFCTVAVSVPNCPSFNQPCSAGIGACESMGKLRCNGPDVECTAVAKMPMPEICNGIDDDCNMVVDDNNPEADQMCMTNLPSICKPGITACNAGVLECNPNVAQGSITETCNAVDDDCNGVVDDGYNVGDACTLMAGDCTEQGKFACDAMGGVVCDAPMPQSKPELCDGVDNDCDGVVDNGLGLGTLCSVGVGECAALGMQICDALGGVVCSANPAATKPEICGDAKDNDCDGVVDNGCGDGDGDGLTDGFEVQIGSNPNDADSDDDGLLDGDEVSPDVDSDGDGVINVLDTDSDNDGLFDGTEMGVTCGHPATAKHPKHCRPDADTGQTTTDPLDRDSNDNGITDGSEDANLNGKAEATDGDPQQDFDGDGLSDALEAFLHSNEKDADSDDDGLLDGTEHNLSDDTDGDGFLNVLDPDSDGDALFDGTEAGKGCTHPATNTSFERCIRDEDAGTTKTSALLKDTDHGGVSDGSEDSNLDGRFDTKELDPNDRSDDMNIIDSDNDGLSDGLEVTLASDKLDADTDNDGLLDGEELDPSIDWDGDGAASTRDPDSDNDVLFDGTEAGKPCSHPDTDTAANKCIADADNGQTTTGILDADTDDGTKPDGAEDKNGNGIVDTQETNPLAPGDDIPPPPECSADADCGNVTSGRVCVQLKCTDGCRGVGGNRCPGELVCSSLTSIVGQCEPRRQLETTDQGCTCRTAGSDDNSPVGFGLSLGALALCAMRRRRR